METAYQKTVNNLTGALGPTNDASWPYTGVSPTKPWELNEQPLVIGSNNINYQNTADLNAAPSVVAVKEFVQTNAPAFGKKKGKKSKKSGKKGKKSGKKGKKGKKSKKSGKKGKKSGKKGKKSGKKTMKHSFGSCGSCGVPVPSI